MNAVLSLPSAHSHARAVGLLRWLLLLWLTGCVAPSTAPEPDPRSLRAEYSRVAAAIRARYDEALPSLPRSHQRHYAQRLYRVTGDARYLPINQTHGRRLLARLNAEIQALGVPGHAEDRAQERLAAYPARTPKQRARKRMLAQWGQIPYAESLAFDLTQARYHGLLNDEMIPGHRQALDYLAGIDFRRFVLDPDVLAVYAAQVANLTYYLHGLGVADLRSDVAAAFRRLYPPERDAALTDAEYRNKVYGMTHLVIAASDYYQKPVPAGTFDWVLDEFADSLDAILARTKEDIYTEVGVSFLLAGKADHPAVARLRGALLDAYDPAVQMIPSEQGTTDLAAGEHRNVLAIMLLNWPAQLHPGPILDPRLLRCHSPRTQRARCAGQTERVPVPASRGTGSPPHASRYATGRTPRVCGQLGRVRNQMGCRLQQYLLIPASRALRATPPGLLGRRFWWLCLEDGVLA